MDSLIFNQILDSDYNSFSTDFHEIMPSSMVEENVTFNNNNNNNNNSNNTAIWNQESFIPFFGINNGASNIVDIMQPETDVIMSSVFRTSSIFERSGMTVNPIMDVLEPPVFSDFDINSLRSVATGLESFGVHDQFQSESSYESTMKCNQCVSDFQPIYGNDATDVWGNQGSSVPSIEEPSAKVHRYSVEERKDKILKYLKKRNQRNFNKTIKYACRKTLADRRIRVRGRFARNDELSENSKTTENNNIHHEEEEYFNDVDQIKDNGEEWLQEAVTSLMYLPIFAG